MLIIKNKKLEIEFLEKRLKECNNELDYRVSQGFLYHDPKTKSLLREIKILKSKKRNLLVKKYFHLSNQKSCFF